MKTNIPIYRAKKIGSDEYIIGQYLAYKGYSAIFNEYGLDGIDIDDTTLSIHFPDMIDRQGNKIFVSLQEDGKGGDIVNLDERCGENFNAVALYRYYEIHLKGGIDLLNRAKYLRCYPKKDIKVIGIQQ